MTTYKNKDPNAIAIIGGGLAGSLTLLNLLLRIAKDPKIVRPVEILSFERKPEQRCRGIAYRKVPEIANDPAAKPNLNIGSKRVTPFMLPELPEGFPTFVQYIQDRAKSDPEIINNLCNPSRALYGDYITSLVGLAKERAQGKAIVRDGDGENRNIVKIKNTKGGKILTCDKGTVFRARKIILATGFLRALAPQFAQAVVKSSRYLNYPYANEANAFFDKVAGDKNSRVLVIGTGLTSMDIAARLIQQGHTGKIVMISRRALTHKPYEETSVEDYLARRLNGEPRPESDLPFTREPPKFLQHENLGTAIKAAVREFKGLLKQGYTSEEIMGYWEKFVPQVAAQFPHSALSHLLSENSVLFTTLRVGVTPDIGRTIRKAVKNKQVSIVAGGIRDLQETDNGIVCAYAPLPKRKTLRALDFNQSSGQVKKALFDYAVSGMGNTTDCDINKVRMQDALMADLLESGTVVPHWTKNGIAVTQDFALIDAQGRVNPDMFSLGVPVSGHMTVGDYPYLEKPGTGGRLGPASLNIPCITISCRHMLNSHYDGMTAPYAQAAQPERPAVKRRKLATA